MCRTAHGVAGSCCLTRNIAHECSGDAILIVKSTVSAGPLVLRAAGGLYNCTRTRSLLTTMYVENSAARLECTFSTVISTSLLGTGDKENRSCEVQNTCPLGQVRKPTDYLA